MSELRDARPAFEHILSTGDDDTLSLGRRIARSLHGTGLVLLRGDLGTGKSVLARGIGQELGVSRWKGSPTFTIINEYDTEPPLYHADLYRLTEPEIEELGLEEIVRANAVVVIEWPERATRYLNSLSAVPPILIEIEHGAGDNLRTIRISTTPEGAEPA